MAKTVGNPQRRSLGWSRFAILIGVTLSALLLLDLGCNQRHKQVAPVPTEPKPIMIGGKEPIVLTRLQTGNDVLPEFLSATLLPGRAMQVFQVTAYIPGRGITDLLVSPTLEQAAALMTGTGDDEYGNLNHKFGGAFLVPFANRIRGHYSPDTKTITTSWHGHTLTLPANAHGKGQNPEPVAMHGLMQNIAFDQVDTNTMPDGGVATALFHAGNFGGHWPSQTDVSITVLLSGRAFDTIITLKNVGNEPEPIGVGWHPYFAIPSGERAQATLHVPSTTRTEINNYQDVFPTGRLLPVAGTPYDFSAHQGAPLGHTYVDDNYVHLKGGLLDNGPVVELRDPAAHYGLRMTALSPAIKAIQIYSPPDKNFVAIEPQFNWADPFGSEWKGEDTGMVTLQPGQSVTWKVRLELFNPDTLGDQKPAAQRPLIP